MEDDGCPTCGSKKFENIEEKKDDAGIIFWRKQCNNCKKFWYS